MRDCSSRQVEKKRFLNQYLMIAGGADSCQGYVRHIGYGIVSQTRH